MRRLERYLARHYLRATVGVLAVLLVLFAFLAFVDALDDVGTGAFTSADAFAVTLLTLPRRVVELLPVSALLGAVLGVGALANQREIVAMRAAGVSLHRLARATFVAALLLVALVVLLQNVLVPAAERKAREIRSRTVTQTALGGTAFWSRGGDELVHIGRVEFGLIPRDIELYELDERGRLARMLRADRAEIAAEDWRLLDVEEKLLGEDRVSFRTHTVLVWKSFLSPQQMATLIAPPDALSTLELVRYLREARDDRVDTRRYESMLWRQVAAPISLVALTLLGLPFVLGAPRALPAGYRVVVGGTVGIAFWLLDQITGYLAAIAELPPGPASLTPALLVIALAWAGFRRAA